ncbi:MAG TPA: PRTRC system ThiF family protein [Chloroflexaceae bacterium]|nr:PRTRC system ThiF family protein [Chloroflexaceae bacterium]
MQTLTIDQPIPYLVPPNQPIQIGLVGCGGTGSHIAQSLARMAAHRHERGGPPLRLFFIDGDHVEAHNIGRQIFARAELGNNKAQTLADRLNAALGLDIVAVPEMATAALLGELAPSYQTIGILVGAVDTASGRRAIHEALARSAWRLWLDIGNEHDWGKVLLGTATEQRQLRGALSLGGLCTALPAASLRYPHLLEEPANQPQDDCAGDMRDGLQSLMINQAIAAIAAQYLHQLISVRRITSFETALDLANLTMTSTSITAAALAEASGLTVAEITLTDEPKHQRTRGHS